MDATKKSEGGREDNLALTLADHKPLSKLVEYDPSQNPPLTLQTATGEIRKLRALLDMYEKKNQDLVKKNTALEMKLLEETVTLNDSQAIREMKQAKLALREAKRVLGESFEDIRKNEKLKALTKYWQRETETSESLRAEDLRKFQASIKDRDQLMEKKDEQIAKLKKDLEFMTEKADALEDKLILANDQIRTLESDIKGLKGQLRDLAKLAEEKLREMQKQAEKKIQEILHHARGRMRWFRKQAESGVAIIKRRVHSVVGKWIEKMGTLMPLLVKKLARVKDYYHDIIKKMRKDAEDKEQTYIMKILGIKMAMDKNNKAMNKMGFELEEMTKKADSTWSHLRAVLKIRDMELKITELGSIIDNLKGKIGRQGKKLERLEMARLEALDTVQVKNEQLVVANKERTQIEEARKAIMLIIPRFIAPREKVMQAQKNKIKQLEQEKLIELCTARKKVFELEDKLDAALKANVFKAKVIRKRNKELDFRSKEIAQLVIQNTISVACARSEIAALLREIHRLKMEIERLELELEKEIKLKEEYYDNWQDAEERCRQLKKVVAARDAEIVDLKNTIVEVKRLAKEEQDRLKGVIKDREDTIKARDQTIFEQNHEIKRGKERIEILEERCKSLEDINFKHNARIRELDLDKRRITKEADKLRVKIRKQADTILEWQAAHHDMKLNYDNAIVETKKAKEEVEHMQRRFEHIKSQLRKAERRIKSYKAELEEEIGLHREDNETAKRKEEVLKVELETTKQDYEVWISDLNGQIDDLNKHIAQLQNNQRRLLQAIRIEEQKLKELEREALDTIGDKEEELLKMQGELRKSKSNVMKILMNDHYVSLKKFARFMSVEQRDFAITSREKQLREKEGLLERERKLTRDSIEELRKRNLKLTDMIRQLLEQLTMTDQAINKVIFRKALEEKSETKIQQEIDLVKSARKPAQTSPLTLPYRPDPSPPPQRRAKKGQSPYSLPLGHTISSSNKIRGGGGGGSSGVVSSSISGIPPPSTARGSARALTARQAARSRSPLTMRASPAAGMAQSPTTTTIPGNSRVPTVVLRRRPATARSSSNSSKKHGAPNSRERGTKTNNKSTTRVQNYMAWSGNSSKTSGGGGKQ